MPKNLYYLRLQAYAAWGLVFVLLLVSIVGANWSGASFVVLLFRCAAVALSVYGLLCVLILRGIFPKTSVLLRQIWLVCAALFCLSFIVIEIVIASECKTDVFVKDAQDAEYLIVLGCGIRGTTPSLSLQGRLDAALAYVRTHPLITIVVSGGQGVGEDIPESEAMFRYLRDHGVAPEKILQENQSRNTGENIKFSLTVIENYSLENGLSTPMGESIVVCTNDFHLFRAKSLLNKAGVRAYGLSVPPPYQYLAIAGWVREYFSVIFMGRDVRDYQV